MKKISIYFSAMALLMFFGSCEENANVEVPDIPSKLVVNGFISPQDTLIEIRVTRSQPVFQPSTVDINDPVSNATVTIYNSANVPAQLSFNSVSGVYEIATSSFPVTAGGNYRIEVSASGFETVKASTTVPGSTPGDFTTGLSYSIDSSQISYWTYTVNETYSFTDFSGTGDRYRLSRSMIVFDNFSNDTMYFPAGTDFFADNDNDGQQFTGTNSVQYDFSTSPFGSSTPVAYILHFTRCSNEYYQFHKSLYNNNGGSGDPFSEPTPMYSNVEKGYGIFAGCNYTSVRLNF